MHQVKIYFFPPKEMNVSFSSQHEAAWETSRGCTINVTGLQNLQLSCCGQEGLETWNMAARGCGTLFSTCLSQKVLETYLANILRQRFPKWATQLLQSFRPVQSISLKPSTTWGQALQQTRGGSTFSNAPQRTETGELLLPLPRMVPKSAETGEPWVHYHWNTVSGGAHRKTHPKSHTCTYPYRSHTSVPRKKVRISTVWAEQLCKLNFVLNAPLNITLETSHLQNHTPSKDTLTPCTPLSLFHHKTENEHALLH